MERRISSRRLHALFVCLVVVVTFLACDTAFAFQNRSPSGRQTPSTASSLASTPGAGDFGELTSALATLDQQWQIQQRSNPSPDKPRWSKLMLPKEDDDEQEETESATPFPQQNQDFVWMLEPPNNSIPSCVIVFTGGAGLGQFPQVAYNELLSELSKKLNAVCLTAPYEVGLDHFVLAKSTGEKLRRALLVLDDRREAEGLQQQTGTFPKYSLAHSLGCKLQTIYLAATGISTALDGVGFLAYNNFSFAKTISMARSFAQELRGNNNNNMNMGNPEMINSLFDFAEMAVGAIGVEFSPTPGDTERLIQLRYNAELQQKTRIFKFDTDQLDSSVEFRSACDSFDTSDTGDTTSKTSSSVDVSNLQGGHLTPVYFQWNADDLAKDAMGNFADTGGVSQENLNMAREAMGGFQGASFGDEPNFMALVDEVSDWILGKPPKQQPARPQISGKNSSA
eukprot:CAMPEP_0116140746 /NCGR_PEP_ID=MMETSP0329-20121206/14020_1 /TAXON_ID=697910 /ORGANISM="Pseudo-nitzschia arenysensis, Strain B593" /LENGTH=452 /DNA_ID=CAMNT_0003635897 /DNA_START=136 /DNA_END=1494 /DNA_ORIENTATION=+